jgi:hypothetical protein
VCSPGVVPIVLGQDQASRQHRWVERPGRWSTPALHMPHASRAARRQALVRMPSRSGPGEAEGSPRRSRKPAGQRPRRGARISLSRSGGAGSVPGWLSGPLLTWGSRPQRLHV